MVEHVHIKFGDPSCISFWDIMQKTDKQIHKHINVTGNATHATAISTGNKDEGDIKLYYGLIEDSVLSSLSVQFSALTAVDSEQLNQLTTTCLQMSIILVTVMTSRNKVMAQSTIKIR